MTIAWAFPGQGSQKIGMAEPVLSIPGAIDRFELASEILGRDLLAICNGSIDSEDKLSDLNDTRNTQPALFVVESLLVDALKGQGAKVDYVAGHSLGEFVALYAAEVFDLNTALVLLKTRSELMALVGGGAMTAVLGFDRANLEELVANTQGVVIANDNSQEQVVLSGTKESVDSVTSSLKCKKTIPLNVSGAFHSPFMEKAAVEFSVLLDDVRFSDGILPVLSNADPDPSNNGDLLKSRLKLQMISGVRWRETMEIMQQNSIETFLEIGPGKVLSGLAKRSMKGVNISQFSMPIDLGNSL